MADIVEAVLQQSAENAVKYQPIDVSKDLELEIDVGNLLATDHNVIDLKAYRSNREVYLKNLARDDVQLLINKIWELPAERHEDVIVAKLPAPTTKLPREKPLPKPNPPTKWQQYAKDKGIQNKTKSKLVWDNVIKDWRPRWGFKSSQNQKDWLLEVPENADPYQDQFAKQKEVKGERVAKNELQRLRNIARNHNIKLPAPGLPSDPSPSRDQVTKALSIARTSTASMGQFTATLPKEKPNRKMGKKRKFEPLFGDMKKEKEKNLEILDRIRGKQPRLDTSKATFSKEITTENEPSTSNSSSKTKAKGKGKRRGGGGKRSGKDAKMQRGKGKKGKGKR